MYEYFALAWGQGFKLRSKGFRFGMTLPQLGVLRFSMAYDVEQIIILHRLGQKIESSGSQRLHSRGNVSVPCNEHDRARRTSEGGQRALNRKAVQGWH